MLEYALLQLRIGSTNRQMLQLEISKSWMVEDGGIPCPIHGDGPFTLNSFKQLLACGILEGYGLPTHWALRAPLAPFEDALEVELVLAARHRGWIAVAEGLEADAAGVIARLLYPSFDEGCGGGQVRGLHGLHTGGDGGGGLVVHGCCCLNPKPRGGGGKKKEEGEKTDAAESQNWEICGSRKTSGVRVRA